MNKSLIVMCAAVAMAAPSVMADTTLVITGSTAFRSVLYDRLASVLAGETVVNGANSNIRSFTNGTVSGHAELGNVSVHFNGGGSKLGITDLRDQTSLTLAIGGTAPATVTFSDTFPQTVSVDPALFTLETVGVVPFLFFKSATATSMAGITNLTQRQVSYLMGSAGTLPTSFFGGESASDILYLVGRDTGSGTRAVTDANIYFTGTAANWWKNTGNNNIELHPQGGFASGSLIGPGADALINAVGYAGIPDIGGRTTLAYEGVTYSAANVQQGKYPIWGYEFVAYKASGGGTPSANQITLIQLINAAIKDNAYQTGNANYVNFFVPLAGMEVERTTDGGPITSTVY